MQNIEFWNWKDAQPGRTCPWQNFASCKTFKSYYAPMERPRMSKLVQLGKLILIFKQVLCPLHSIPKCIETIVFFLKPLEQHKLNAKFDRFHGCADPHQRKHWLSSIKDIRLKLMDNQIINTFTVNQPSATAYGHVCQLYKFWFWRIRLWKLWFWTWQILSRWFGTIFCAFSEERCWHKKKEKKKKKTYRAILSCVDHRIEQANSKHCPANCSPKESQNEKPSRSCRSSLVCVCLLHDTTPALRCLLNY